MAIVDRAGLPIAVHVASASPYEPHLVPATLEARFLGDLPTRLIGDRGYDSDPPDDTLHAHDIIASKARLASAPPAASASASACGVICQERPQRSLHQPHAFAWPPL